MFEIDTNFSSAKITKITVAGVGGGGINAVNRMISKNHGGLNFVAVDTDENSLSNSKAPIHIKIDGKAPQEIQNEILKTLEGSKLVFIVAGMGGDTGTKLEAIIANYAQGLHALTVAVVTVPLAVENLKEKAANGINNLRNCADSIVIIFNDNIAKIVDGKISLTETFDAADELLAETVFGIADLINVPGVVDLDFEDIKEVLKNSGCAFMGMGEATGENATMQAAKNALNSSVFAKGLNNVHSLLISFKSSNDSLLLTEVNEAATLIQDAVAKDAEILWGTSIDETFGNTVRVTIIATRLYR